MSTKVALLASLPWLVLPPIALARVARSRSLDDESPRLDAAAPRISVIVPARNEARNIERCVRSVLASTYPALEVIVVDDHSEDGTGHIARGVAAADPRLRVLESPALPSGWFGKQWACATGASAARGDLLLFIDADTWHTPDLLARALNAMRSRNADLLSVAGRPDTRSFWEHLLQPQMFWMLLARYGGTEGINGARRPEDVIASGAFLLVRRSAYDAIGGHESVRGKVAEDLALAQRFSRSGYRVAMVLGRAQLSMHMYASLSELVAGWGKNVYAGGIDAVPGGRLGRLLFPFVLPLFPLTGVVPLVALVLALVNIAGQGWLIWSATCLVSSVVWWAIIYRGFDQPSWYALLHPLGATVVLYIFLRAIARGRRVGWKGREYVSR